MFLGFGVNFIQELKYQYFPFVDRGKWVILVLVPNKLKKLSPNCNKGCLIGKGVCVWVGGGGEGVS